MLKQYYIDNNKVTREEALEFYYTHTEIHSQGLKVRRKKSRGGEYYIKKSAYYIDYDTRELKYFYILEFYR